MAITTTIKTTTTITITAAGAAAAADHDVVCGSTPVRAGGLWVEAQHIPLRLDRITHNQNYKPVLLPLVTGFPSFWKAGVRYSV